MHEQQILDHYSTPGLRKNQFTRAQKKDWLGMSYPKMDRTERDKILSQLFGHEDSELHISDRKSPAAKLFAPVTRRDDGRVIIQPTLDELASITA